MTMSNHSQIDDRQEVVYRLPAVITITGKGGSTIYRDIKDGTFPRPIKLGPQTSGWKKSDIDRWIAQRPVAKITRRIRRAS
jgi:prophage regulatory protein